MKSKWFGLIFGLLASSMLSGHPDLTRAWARWQLGKPRAAAQDYAAAISFSERPSPALYRSLVITQFASGGDLLAQSAATVAAGLQRFPGEISLLGLGVDLALAEPDVDRAAGYMNALSAGLMRLPQWIFRQAVLACLQGDIEVAVAGFVSLMPTASGQVSKHSGNWTSRPELIEKLSADANPQTCREAVIQTLKGQQP